MVLSECIELFFVISVSSLCGLCDYRPFFNTKDTEKMKPTNLGHHLFSQWLSAIVFAGHMGDALAVELEQK